MAGEDKIIHISRVESWTIPGVSYRGKSGTYELIGEMTPAMNQDDLIAKYGVEIPSSPLFWAVVSKVYDIQDADRRAAESFRSFVQTGLRRYPNTSTRVIYNPSGKDEIIHNFGTPEKYSLRDKIVGPDDFLSSIPDKKVLESLLETSNVNKINKVANWINKTDSYLWRLNSKPTKKEERVVWFDADSGGLFLVCVGDPLSEYPAFRVVRVE